MLQRATEGYRGLQNGTEGHAEAPRSTKRDTRGTEGPQRRTSGVQEGYSRGYKRVLPVWSGIARVMRGTGGVQEGYRDLQKDTELKGYRRVIKGVQKDKGGARGVHKGTEGQYRGAV